MISLYSQNSSEEVSAKCGLQKLCVFCKARELISGGIEVQTYSSGAFHFKLNKELVRVLLWRPDGLIGVIPENIHFK